MILWRYEKQRARFYQLPSKEYNFMCCYKKKWREINLLAASGFSCLMFVWMNFRQNKLIVFLNDIYLITLQSKILFKFWCQELIFSRFALLLCDMHNWVFLLRHNEYFLKKLLRWVILLILNDLITILKRNIY